MAERLRGPERLRGRANVLGGTYPLAGNFRPEHRRGGTNSDQPGGDRALESTTRKLSGPVGNEWERLQDIILCGDSTG